MFCLDARVKLPKNKIVCSSVQLNGQVIFITTPQEITIHLLTACLHALRRSELPTELMWVRLHGQVRRGCRQRVSLSSLLHWHASLCFPRLFKNARGNAGLKQRWVRPSRPAAFQVHVVRPILLKFGEALSSYPLFPACRDGRSTLSSSQALLPPLPSISLP